MSVLRTFTSAPIALGAVVWSPLRTTLIAKSIFVLDASGTLELEPVAPPLSLDEFDGRGEIVYPSDFTPYKPGCDVVIGGLDAIDRRMAGYFSLGTLACSVGPSESLGPRESFCPAGDPTDPGVQSTWTGGGMEFSRFHCASPGQRMPWPSGPFQVELARGALSLRGRWFGPSPTLTIEVPGGARVPVAMPLDTIVLLPSDKRLVAVWRAIVDTPGAGELRARIDVPSTHPADVPTWTEVVPTRPAELRMEARGRTPDVMPDQTQIAKANEPMAWPFGGARTPEPAHASAPEWEPDSAPEPERTRAAVVRTPAKTLPFRHQQGERRPSASPPADFGELRAAQPVRPASDAAEGTVALRPTSNPVGAPGAFGQPDPRSPIPLFRLAPEAPAMVIAPLPQASAAIAPPSPEPPARLGAPAPPVAEEPGLDQVAAIQREIWKGDRPLAAILVEHGLTESTWRALRRAAKS